MIVDKVLSKIDELIEEAKSEPLWKTENALRTLKKEIEKEDFHHSIVFCNRCKHFDTYNVECLNHHNPKPPYDKWFCADGEKDGDQE